MNIQNRASSPVACSHEMSANLRFRAGTNQVSMKITYQGGGPPARAYGKTAEKLQSLAKPATARIARWQGSWFIVWRESG